MILLEFYSSFHSPLAKTRLCIAEDFGDVMEKGTVPHICVRALVLMFPRVGNH